MHVTRPDGVHDQLTLEQIRDPASVRDLVNRTAHQARMRETTVANTQHLHHAGAPATPAPAAPTGGADPYEQLAQLGKLRDAGVLSDEEFAEKKATILSRI